MVKVQCLLRLESGDDLQKIPLSRMCVFSYMYRSSLNTMCVHMCSGGTGPNPRLGPLNRVNGLVVLGLLATVVYSVEKPAQRLGPWP